MVYHRHTLLLALWVLAFLALASVHVSAHSPSNMSLSYDVDTNELAVQVTHSVDNPSAHYVEEVIVLKNSVEVASRSYTSQASSTGMSDVFSIEATAGDVISVTASCSIAGSITRQITGESTTTTTSQTTTTTGDGGIQSDWLLVMGGVAALIVVLAVVALIRRA